MTWENSGYVLLVEKAYLETPEQTFKCRAPEEESADAVQPGSSYAHSSLYSAGSFSLPRDRITGWQRAAHTQPVSPCGTVKGI